MCDYRIYCELVITSDKISPAVITEQSGIKPYRLYEKGDVFKSKHSKTQGKRRSNLWAIKSDIIISDIADISPSIKGIRDLLLLKLEMFKKLKANIECNVVFWIWVESKESATGIDLVETDLTFINEISNRLHFSFVPILEKKKHK